MKIELSQSVQQILRCSECDELLSCGPVFLIHETSVAICGRCSPDPEPEEVRKRSRNIQYEAAAQLLSFPCCFAQKGCPQKMDFSPEEVNKHENDCEYREFICPIAGRVDCDWVGNRIHLSEHCNEAHPKHYIENNSSLPLLDLTKSHLTNYLIAAFNFLFLVHVKVCISSGKLCHSVRMFGDTQLLEKFVYCFEVEGNNNKLIERGSILPRGIMMLQESSAIHMTIQSLLEFLGNDLKFIVKIQTLANKCVNCFKNIDGACLKFCHKCEINIKKCEFHVNGCLFTDVSADKCRKHEHFFCEYQRKCYSCKVNFVGGSFIEHLKSANSCQQTIQSNISSIVRLTKTKSNYNMILFSHENIGCIICRYNLSNSMLQLWLWTSLPSYELKQFECFIELIDPKTEHSQLLKPQIIIDFGADWNIHEQMHHFTSWNNVGLDIKIDIKKISTS